jgi:uncharacterized protein (DUF58 family)
MVFGNKIMLSQELLKKIRRIELRTKRILNGYLIGDYRTRSKGFGLEFDQLADYQFGDDIRFVDWKSSARMNKMLIKEYHDERNRTIFLLIDGSQSNWFGSTSQLKNGIVAEIAGVLAFAAAYNKDHVGMLLFTDKIEQSLPPKKGIKHAHKIMQRLFSFEPIAEQTNLTIAFEQLARIKKSDALVFVVSDFIDEDFTKAIRIVSKKHDLVAIRCLDQYERNIPPIGYVHCQDIETGEDMTIDTKQLYSWGKQRYEMQNNFFKKYKIDYLDVMPGKPFMEDIILFLRRRMS